MPGSGSREWRRVCAIAKRTLPPICHLCQQPIDITLRWPNPQSWSGDHIIPTSRGGRDTLANCAPSHLTCNTARHDRDLGTTKITSRLW